MENKKKIVTKAMKVLFIISIVFILGGALLFKKGMDEKDKTVKINAFIYKIESEKTRTSSPRKESHTTYLIYTYKKKLYTDIPYHGGYDPSWKVGDMISVRIHPDKPDEIYTDNTLVIFGIMLMVIGGAFLFIIVKAATIRSGTTLSGIIPVGVPGRSSCEYTFSTSQEEIESLIQEFIIKFRFEPKVDKKSGEDYYRVGNNITTPYIFFKYFIEGNEVKLEFWYKSIDGEEMKLHKAVTEHTLPYITELGRLMQEIEKL